MTDLNQIPAADSIELFRGDSNVYAVLGLRGTEKWGMSITASPTAAGTDVVLRFAVMCGDNAVVKTKLFKRRAVTHFKSQTGEKVYGYRSHKLDIPFAQKGLSREQFVALADEHEVWEKLESLIITAYAYEGITLIKGIDIAGLLRSKFEVPPVEEAGYVFEMPNLGIFNGLKPAVAGKEPEPKTPEEAAPPPPKGAFGHADDELPGPDVGDGGDDDGDPEE